MLILNSIRCANDEGGMACGPVDASYMVELGVTDNAGKLRWVFLSKWESSMIVKVSQVPIMDMVLASSNYGVDQDKEFERIESYDLEDYSYEYGDPSEEMLESSFAKAIYLARAAVLKYYWADTQEKGEKEMLELVEPFIDKDFDEITMPELKVDELDEEDLEEEEE